MIIYHNESFFVVLKAEEIRAFHHYKTSSTHIILHHVTTNELYWLKKKISRK